MKLYEIPRDSKIRLTIVGEEGEPREQVCTFKHVDGMYSLIITEGGNPVHLGAFTELKEIDGVYEPIT